MISKEGINENDYLELSYANIVKNTSYENTNVEKVLNGIDAVIFSGGEDISPSLYKNVVDWHHIETEKFYNPTRDVSDYILMSYCLDKNIPIMGICRGMQMLAVVSGGEMIQDIPTFFRENGLIYNNEFRQDLDGINNDYATPTIDIIDKNSKIYGVCNADKIEKVPS